MRSFILPLLTLALALPVFAVDGVLEINQAKALAGDVSTGDAPGFPVTLAPGNYLLTSDLLVVGNADISAIEVTSNTTIDLNGFTIRGPIVCDGAPLPTCNGSGSGSGIRRVGSIRHVVIKNGTVRGFGAEGIRIGGDNHLHRAL